MSKRWTSANTCVYNVAYHIIFCPKYRRKVLISPIDERLKQILMKTASEHGWYIEKIEVMPDHVHIFIKANTTTTIARIVNELKGKSSRILREEFASLKSRIPTLWTRSYYVETIGHISEDTIKRYIEDQKKV